jgi:oleate hydratase
MLQLWIQPITTPQFYTKEDSQAPLEEQLRNILDLVNQKCLTQYVRIVWECTRYIKDTAFFDQMEKFSVTKQEQTGSQVTLKDSNWFMSFSLNKQPHYKEQPENVQVFFTYGLHPDRVGNFVGKPLNCSEKEP